MHCAGTFRCLPVPRRSARPGAVSLACSAWRASLRRRSRAAAHIGCAPCTNSRCAQVERRPSHMCFLKVARWMRRRTLSSRSTSIVIVGSCDSRTVRLSLPSRMMKSVPLPSKQDGGECACLVLFSQLPCAQAACAWPWRADASPFGLWGWVIVRVIPARLLKQYCGLAKPSRRMPMVSGREERSRWAK
ncbi:hypothetical protein D3C72_1776880 [compost metagenome]